MSNLGSGLSEFLGHISRQPFHPTLVERYLSLTFELATDERQEAMDHLNRVLLEPNPHLALRSNYHYMQHVRDVENKDFEEEIFVLQLVQSCFRELGRYKQAAVIGEEIVRLIDAKPKAEHVAVVRSISVNLFEDEEPHDALEPYEQTGQEFLFELKKQLGTIQSMRHQRLAIEKLIHGIDALYHTAEERIGNAIRTYGRNPMLWMTNGEFRPALATYILECRVFQMGQDKLTPLRVQMLFEMLCAYYDQRLMRPESVEQERDTRLKLLSEMVTIFLDVGVSFPSYVMGAS